MTFCKLHSLYKLNIILAVTTTVDSPLSGETGQINILGLVVFSVLIGIVLGRMGHKAKPLIDFCTCLTDASMNLFIVFIWSVFTVYGEIDNIIFKYQVHVYEV